MSPQAQCQPKNPLLETLLEISLGPQNHISLSFPLRLHVLGL